MSEQDSIDAMINSFGNLSAGAQWIELQNMYDWIQDNPDHKANTFMRYRYNELHSLAKTQPGLIIIE